jgi:hypothetical protein
MIASMSRYLLPLISFWIVLWLLIPNFAYAQCDTKKDTCLVGMYIKNIYDLRPEEYAYSADFWIWFNYKDKSLDPLDNVEIINAKQAAYTDQYHAPANKNMLLANESGRVTVIHDWKSENYPFDRQHLRIILEAGLDTSQMILKPIGIDFKLYQGLLLPGWDIISHRYTAKLVTYDSDFGETCLKGKSTFSRITYEVEVKRQSWGLFCKLLLGVYISFLVNFLAFFISPSRDQRFGLSIGGLFAAIANKYIMDSNIPASISFSFVDQVHVVTFTFILVTLTLSAVSLKLYKNPHLGRKLFDRTCALVVAIAYAVINIALIISAMSA